MYLARRELVQPKAFAFHRDQALTSDICRSNLSACVDQLPPALSQDQRYFLCSGAAPGHSSVTGMTCRPVAPGTSRTGLLPAITFNSVQVANAAEHDQDGSRLDARQDVVRGLEPTGTVAHGGQNSLGSDSGLGLG